MFLQTTLGTDKRSLRSSARSIDMSAPVASLRGVRCGNLSDRPSAPSELVAEHFGKTAPTRVQNSSGKAGVGLDHVADLQLFDDDGAVAIGVVVRDLMQNVLALPPYFPMDGGDASLRLLPVLRAFLPSCDSPLRAGKPPQRPFQVRRVLDRLAVRVRGKQNDAAIESDNGNGAGDGIGNLNLAKDRSEPLIAVSSDRAGLRLSFEGSVNDRPHLSELGKVETIADKVPSLRMRLAETDGVAAFSFPARSPSKLLEAALPSFVEFDEKLRLNVTRNVGKPRNFSSKDFQLVDLVEGGKVSTVAFRATKACLPLFESKIPKEARGAFPSGELLNLLSARVNPKSESFSTNHKENRNSLSKKSKKTSTPRKCKERGSASP